MSESASSTRSTSPAPAAGAPRRPRQPRGEARVDTILNAASALIGEAGTAAVSMHAVARRAGASIGSMYHFFRDRESLLEALAQRHLESIRRINREIVAIPAATWQRQSPREALATLVTPFMQHLQAHPDFLPVMHGRKDAQGDADFIQGIRSMLDARLAHLPAGRRASHAAMFHALAAGAMQVGYERDPGQQALYLKEIPRALAAYLAAIEAEPGG